MYFNRLFLMYDDQKTAQLLWDIKKKQWETDDDYDKYDYILSVLMLFHFCMNLLYLIQQSHMSTAQTSSSSTLFHHMNFWKRKNISFMKSSFHHIEKLILHSFDAHVLDMMYVHLWMTSADEKIVLNCSQIKSCLKRMILFSFLQMIKNIQCFVFDH